MSEDEAKTKACQETFAKSSYSCLGSGCMAWRWIVANPKVVEEARALGFEPARLIHGYCGKAGKP